MWKPLRNIEREFLGKVGQYIIGAFGLIAGLAWNEAIRALIEYWFPAEEGASLLAKFIYAAAITFVVVIVTIYLSKLFVSRAEKKSS